MPYEWALHSFIAMFVGVMAVCITVIVIQWHKNNRAPKVVVGAAVAAKRIQKMRRADRHPRTGMRRVRCANLYYARFSLAGGDSVELCLRSGRREYDRLRVGDAGKLTFQGTRYLGFEKSEKKGCCP